MKFNPEEIVIVGQGYVGLPLALEASRAYPSVHGLEISESTVQTLQDGKSHIREIASNDVSRALGRGYKPTTNTKVLETADVIVICVPTPLSLGQEPDLSILQGVAKLLEKTSPGVLVILESTSYPGTTEDFLLPPLQSGRRIIDRDFFLAFSPERIDPGNQRFGISNTPRLVGGVSELSGRHAVTFYSRFVSEVVQLSGAKEAEMAKLIENTYRHVNIALVNELLKISRGLGVNFWEAQKGASTKPFGFQAFWPSSGVGGHCIPIDPQYLTALSKKKLDYTPRFIELANMLNESMPAYTIQRVTEEVELLGIEVEKATILVLGVTFKPDVADTRETPAVPVIRGLRTAGFEVIFHDPYVNHLLLQGSDYISAVDDPYLAAKTADLTLILQAHNKYDFGLLTANSRSLLDASGAIVTGCDTRL